MNTLFQGARWKSRRTCAHLLLQELQNCNSQLNNHLQENVGSHQKKIPPPLQEDGRRGEIAFRIKPYTHQRCQEGSNKTLCTPGPRDPTETEPDLTLSVCTSPVEVQVSSDLLQGRDSGCSRPGSHRACGMSPLGGGHHLPHHRATEQMTYKLQNNYIK